VAAEIKRDLGIEAALVRGPTGVFDVAVDGKVIFSRHETGRFPHDGEIVQALRS
jgi:selT/selW/selH-like putative selenoprotein